MTEHTWKIEKNLCRCCHSEGAFTNLAEPCLNLGEEEIFSQMLLESFDVNVAPVTGPLCEVTYTICDGCIQRLRDACYFKRQVVKCEKRFHDLYSKNVIKFDSCYEVKVEAPDSDDEDDMKLEMFEDEDDFAVKSDDDEKKLEVQIEVEEVTPKPKRKVAPKRKAKNTKVISKLRKKLEAPGKAKDKTEEDAEESAEAEAAKQRKEKKGAVIPREDMTDYTILEDGMKKRFSCNKCGTILSTMESMRMHIVAGHFKMKSFECPLCDDKFKHKATKKLHLAKKHGMEEAVEGGKKVLQPAKKCICDVCKKEFASRTLLTRHIPTHKLVTCPECSAVFSKDEIAFHRFEAHEVAIPTCGICGYKNSRQCRVITHQRKVHLKEKNLSCPECDAKFFDTVQLKKHLVRHNPVRIYECSFCKKKFPRLNALREHEKIHTGDKRKVCPVCNERFVQKASLNYHMGKHHPEAS